MEPNIDIISLIGQLSFPIAVSIYLLVSVTKQLNQVKRNQIKILMLLGLMMRELGQNGNVLNTIVDSEDDS